MLIDWLWLKPTVAANIATRPCGIVARKRAGEEGRFRENDFRILAVGSLPRRHLLVTSWQLRCAQDGGIRIVQCCGSHDVEPSSTDWASRLEQRVGITCLVEDEEMEFCHALRSLVVVVWWVRRVTREQVGENPAGLPRGGVGLALAPDMQCTSTQAVPGAHSDEGLLIVQGTEQSARHERARNPRDPDSIALECFRMPASIPLLQLAPWRHIGRKVLGRFQRRHHLLIASTPITPTLSSSFTVCQGICSREDPQASARQFRLHVCGRGLLSLARTKRRKGPGMWWLELRSRPRDMTIRRYFSFLVVGHIFHSKQSTRSSLLYSLTTIVLGVG